ncbi:MAG: hypothetical protein ABJA67_05670 [Chthonomonadales bacterium]
MQNEINAPQPEGFRLSTVPIIISACAVVAIWFLTGAISERSKEMDKTACVTIERRLSTAILLYAQDHDSRLPIPNYEGPNGEWRSWPDLLRSYVASDEKLVCPLLSVADAKEIQSGYDFPAGCTLNERFYGTFGPGPFPIENLEMPAQTAMLVEGGRFQVPGKSGWFTTSTYGDLATQPDRYSRPHSGRLNVAAADGHVVTLKPATKIFDHDRLYGRLAGTIYNWNGGHPNGETVGPPRE